MEYVSCGIDFGTSNSSIAVALGGDVQLVPVEDSHLTIPSAIYFAPGKTPVFGREAITHFFQRERDSRFMRSLKRVLGTSLMKQGTVINNKAVKFDKILSYFLQHIKDKAESHANHTIEHVVMGRPVHFIDNDPEGDKRAEEELRAIAKGLGFKYIEFQFEPIAAAFAHEVNLRKEQLALVVDLGGGTSDFTVIRLGKQNATSHDRASDILANTGVRIGGNDFDKAFCLSSIMPSFGYRSTYGPKRLEVPLKYYHDLSEWSKVNFLYTPKTLMQVRQFLHESHDKPSLKRLLTVLEEEQGHTLLSVAEGAKIDLTDREEVQIAFEFVKDDFSQTVSRATFENIIQDLVNNISDTARSCLALANVKATDIKLVILTGGTTEVPLVQHTFKTLFPDASIADQNKLSSVGLGLAYDSARRFE